MSATQLSRHATVRMQQGAFLNLWLLYLLSPDCLASMVNSGWIADNREWPVLDNELKYSNGRSG